MHLFLCGQARARNRLPNEEEMGSEGIKRIIRIKCMVMPRPLPLAQVYAPTYDTKEEEIEEFYRQLSVAKIHSEDVVFLDGKFNAKVG